MRRCACYMRLTTVCCTWEHSNSIDQKSTENRCPKYQVLVHRGFLVLLLVGRRRCYILWSKSHGQFPNSLPTQVYGLCSLVALPHGVMHCWKPESRMQNAQQTATWNPKNSCCFLVLFPVGRCRCYILWSKSHGQLPNNRPTQVHGLCSLVAIPDGVLYCWTLESSLTKPEETASATPVLAHGCCAFIHQRVQRAASVGACSPFDIVRCLVEQPGLRKGCQHPSRYAFEVVHKLVEGKVLGFFLSI